MVVVTLNINGDLRRAHLVHLPRIGELVDIEGEVYEVVQVRHYGVSLAKAAPVPEVTVRKEGNECPIRRSERPGRKPLRWPGCRR